MVGCVEQQSLFANAHQQTHMAQDGESTSATSVAVAVTTQPKVTKPRAKRAPKDPNAPPKVTKPKVDAEGKPIPKKPRAKKPPQLDANGQPMAKKPRKKRTVESGDDLKARTDKQASIIAEMKQSPLARAQAIVAFFEERLKTESGEVVSINEQLNAKKKEYEALVLSASAATTSSATATAPAGVTEAATSAQDKKSYAKIIAAKKRPIATLTISLQTAMFAVHKTTFILHEAQKYVNLLQASKPQEAPVASSSAAAATAVL